MGEGKVKGSKTRSDGLRKESCSDQESKSWYRWHLSWTWTKKVVTLPKQETVKQCCKVEDKGMFSVTETPASSQEYAVSSKPSVLTFPEGSKETLMLD